MTWNNVLREAERRRIQEEFERMEQEAVDALDFAAYLEAQEYRLGAEAALVKKYGPETVDLSRLEMPKRKEKRPTVIRIAGWMLAKIRGLASKQR